MRPTILALTAALALGACTDEEVIRGGQVDNSSTPVGGGALFCPRAFVPRADMARYLERMKRGRDFVPRPPDNIYRDVPPDTVEAAWIEQLARDGITKGTTPDTFSPNDTVPREQMAAFIVRLIRGADFHRDGPSRFTDVTNPDFVGYIEQLADDGITKGCTATEFCPHDMVPREQMAAFLMRALHPGTPDPAPSGIYADIAADNPLGGRVEQAVAEGIMEPCGRMEWNLPVFGTGGGSGATLQYGDDAPETTVITIPQWVDDYWVYATTRWTGSPWMPVLCPDFNPFSVDMWIHVLHSDDQGADIGEVQLVMRPDNDGWGQIGPQLSGWDTQGHEGWGLNWLGVTQLAYGDWVNFDINTRFTGRTFVLWTKVGGADMFDNGHCGAFWNVMARMR